MGTDLNSRSIQIRDDIIKIEGSMDELKSIVNQRQNFTYGEETVVQSLNSIIGEKALLCHRMHSSYVERIGETLSMIQSIKEREVDVNLFQWKQQQQQQRIGVGINTNVLDPDQIQNYNEMLLQTLWEVKKDLVKLANIHRYFFSNNLDIL